MDEPKVSYTIVDGNIVETDALRIAEKIKEYDPNLTLVCNLRPDHPGDPPFLVIEACRDGINRPVLSAWKLDDTILQRISLADGQIGNQLKIVENWEAEIKKEQTRRYKDMMGELHDIAASVFRNKKSKYTVRDTNTGELLTFYDDRPTTRC